jgi:hypothetical protein
MFSFRRFAFLLALILPACPVLPAQSSSSSSDAAPAVQEQPAPAPAAQANEGQVSVQARIRARREARRAQAIHDTYAHTYELFVGSGYERLVPGPNKQRATMYSWDVAVTRFWNERLGLTLDGRGYYGTAYVGLNSTNSVTRPAISHYDALAGPTYRFYLRPKYSLAARAMGGYAYGNFSGDTNGFGTQVLGLYPDGSTFGLTGSLIGEANVTPNLSLRLAPEVIAHGFGSSIQASYGFTYGIVVRFGKQ